MDDVRNCFIPFFILVFCFFTSYGLGANVTLSRVEDENITLYAQWSGEPIIARVSNDGGRTWTMHSYLINNNYDPSNDSPDQQGAFDYANTLSGEVIIETVLEHHARYTLTDGFSFNGPSTVTLRTTQDEQWNPATDRFTSTIYRGGDFGSLITFENGEAHIENIILDGGTSMGYSCDYDGGLINMESGTLYITDATLQNSYTTGWGGAIYTAGELYLNGTVTFTGCTANEDGGGVYAYIGLEIDGEATFTNCTATGNGGGIYADYVACLLTHQYNPSNSSLTLENCHAGASGGGAYFKYGIHTTWDASSSSINPATITATGCTAGVNGGGFYLSGGVDLYGDPATTGCYITGCSAGTGKGGGIYLHSEPNFAGLIIVEGNTHGSGSDAGLSDSYFRGDRPNYLLVNLMCYDGNGRRDLTTVEVGRPELGGAHKMYGLRMGDGLLFAHLGEASYQALFAPDSIEEVPVRFRAFKEGVFTMKWSVYNGEFSYLHLLDHKTGMDIDCLSSSEYVFEGIPEDYLSRFVLKFKRSGNSVDEYDSETDSGVTFAFMHDGQLVVNGEGRVDLYDIQGCLLESVRVSGDQNKVPLPSLASGVYLLRLTSQGNVRVQKIVINKR